MEYKRVSKEMPIRVHGYLEEELKDPVFTRSMAAKRRRKTLEQPPETLLYNSGLYKRDLLQNDNDLCTLRECF